MLNNVLATIYERDLRRLVDEINLFNSEDNLWKTAGNIENSAGNLVLHLNGGLNHFIGATLADTGYVRNREQEFTSRDVPRNEIISRLQELIPLVTKTLNGLSSESLETEFPVMFDNAKNSKSYVLVQLLAHLNYHLGQINYLRRILE